jgi:hypothetical protein
MEIGLSGIFKGQVVDVGDSRKKHITDPRNASGYRVGARRLIPMF